MLTYQKNILLSIIIPIFNGERTIIKLLENILSISPEYVEFIIVNDGSTDKTHILIESFFTEKNIDRNIYKYYQFNDNKGVSAARNFGITKVKGNYIGFIDSDDIITNDYFNYIIPAIKEDEFDIISFNFIYNNEVMLPSNNTNLIEPVFDICYWQLVSRVYKRNLWKNVYLEIGRHYEDLILLPYIYLKAKKIKHIPEALYIYNKNDNSITQNIKKSDVNDLFFAINKMISFIYTNKNSDKNISMLVNYLINSFFLARKLIKKLDGYYHYDKEQTILIKQIINLVNRYNVKISKSKKRKLQYLQLDTFISRLNNIISR